MLRFRASGYEYEYDETSMLVSEARLIKKHAGFGLTGFSEGLRAGDPDALVAMLFLAKRRSGVACRWQDFDNFDLNTIEVLTDTDEDEDEDGAGAEGNPPSLPQASDDGTTPKS